MSSRKSSGKGRSPGSRARSLDRLAADILRQLGVRKAALDVFLLSNAEMTRLKRRFIKKRTEPNVLAFPEPLHFPHPETRKRHLGEVYLNRDILAKQPERTVPLLVHGILHLLGYDHRKRADFTRMERMERKLLRTP